MAENLTPAHLRCSLGGCPSVHEMEDGDLTPENMRCGSFSSCSSVTSHKGDLVIVGKIAAGLATQIIREDGRLLSETIGADETAIIISPDLLAGLPEILHLRSQVAKFKHALEAIERKYQAVMASPPDWVNLSEEQLKWVREAWYGASLIARAALTEEDKENG